MNIDTKKYFKVIWDRVWIFLIIFIILDIVFSTLLFLKVFHRETEQVIYLPLILNRGLADDFFKQNIKRANIFNKTIQEEYPDLFEGSLLTDPEN